MILVLVKVSTRHILPSANVKKPSISTDSYRLLDVSRTTGSRDNSHTRNTRQTKGGIIEPVPNKPYNPPPDRYTRRLSHAELIFWIGNKGGVGENVRFCT